MNEEILENVYQENLAERIIAHLAGRCDFSYEKAMDVYYSSKLADKIYFGKEGIQYLDYKVLVQILIETDSRCLTEIDEDDRIKIVKKPDLSRCLRMENTML